MDLLGPNLLAFPIEKIDAALYAGEAVQRLARFRIAQHKVDSGLVRMSFCD